MAHASAQPFKDYHLRSQIGNIACIPDQVFSSWCPVSNHTLRMRAGSPVQPNDLGRATSFQAHNREPEDSLWLILNPVRFSYCSIASVPPQCRRGSTQRWIKHRRMPKPTLELKQATAIPRKAGLLATFLSGRLRVSNPKS